MTDPNVVFKYIHNNFVVFHIQLDDLAQPPRNVRTCASLDSSYRQDSKTKILAITRKLRITPMVTLYKFASQLL